MSNYPTTLENKREAGGHASVQGGSTPGGGALVGGMPTGFVTSYLSSYIDENNDNSIQS